MKTTKEMIEIMEWFDNGGEVEYRHRDWDTWSKTINPIWDWYEYDYRIKEFHYPMWFKAKSTGLVVRFDCLQSGSVIETGDAPYKKGEYGYLWIPHTDDRHWVEIQEPKPKQKVMIEKWLIEENDIKFVVETSDIDSWLKSFPTAKKIKLIERYEIEL